MEDAKTLGWLLEMHLSDTTTLFPRLIAGLELCIIGEPAAVILVMLNLKFSFLLLVAVTTTTT